MRSDLLTFLSFLFSPSNRGDGNCFYRAYFFGCLQYLATSKDEPTKQLIVKNLNDSKDKLVAQGLAEYIVEDFWENLMGEVKVSHDEFLAFVER